MSEKCLYEISPIAHIKTGFSSKFGIPRQSGIVSELSGEIIFEKEYCGCDWVRGLDGFSHIWALWVFSENLNSKIGATVRPPKLGGNVRMGVFATRSPYRPNSIGMSVLKIEKISVTADKGTVIYVKGADMLDGTPIIDIKPYLPITDSIPSALSGFSSDTSYEKVGVLLKTVISREVLSCFPSEHRDELIGILEQDPRPAYITDSSRIYSFEFYGFNIKFNVDGNTLNVLSIEKVL